jgi:hypothetical protein
MHELCDRWLAATFISQNSCEFFLFLVQTNIDPIIVLSWLAMQGAQERHDSLSIYVWVTASCFIN